MITLSCLRLSRPLVRRTMSRAWSHGTCCSRNVMLPFTESLTTMFWPLASARICRTARVSMSWKFMSRGSPTYTGLSSAATTALWGGCTSTTYWSSDWYASCSYSPVALIAIRVPLPARVTSKPLIGVPKSDAS